MTEINIIRSKVDTFSRVLESIPEIRYIGDPILRTPTVPVSVEEGVKIGHRLGYVLVRYRKIAGIGRGFAAPQIGENKSVFVTYVDNKLEIFINPVIVERSESTNYYREWCLSSGLMAADVKRSDWIVMKWTDVEGNERKEKVEGFLARLRQHEEDHLRGVVNLDICEYGGIQMATFDPLKEQLRTSR